MKNITENQLEEFIKKNKSEFNVYRPTLNHEEKFMVKLVNRMKRVFINVAPYLIKVGVAVMVVWGISLAFWIVFKTPTLWDLVINLFKK
jgi:cell division septal protein FtsQ